MPSSQAASLYRTSRSISSELIQSVDSTPFSDGTSSNQAFASLHERRHYQRYLECDLIQSIHVDFEEFLDTIFGLPRDWEESIREMSRVVSSSKITKLFNDYLAFVTDETERYHPFALLANEILPQLKVPSHSSNKQPSFSFCRNDHLPIRGSYARRIPDVVTVLDDAFQHLHRLSVDNFSKGSPGGDGNPDEHHAFHWSELLNFVEFKLMEHDLSTAPGVDENDTEQTEIHTGCPTTSSSRHYTKKTPQPSTSKESSRRTRATTSNPSITSSKPHTSSSSSHSRPSTLTSVITDEHIPNYEMNKDARRVTRSSAQKFTAQSGSSLQPAIDLRSLSTSSAKRLNQNRSEAPKKRAKTRNQTDLTPDEMRTQCASYALEILSNGGLRTHVFGALIIDTSLELMYYGRSQPIVSKPVCFKTHPEVLVAYLYGLKKLSLEEWGCPRILKAPPDFIGNRLPALGVGKVSRHVLCGAVLELRNGLRLELEDVIFQQHALIGRGTCVTRAKVVKDYPEWKGKCLVVKFSFPSKGRRAEAELLKDATILARSKEEYGWVLEHLPEALHDEELDAFGKIGERITQMFGAEYERRVLRVMVMTEVERLGELKTEVELAAVIRDIFKCYRWLHDTAGIIHRDISISNLGFRYKGDLGTGSVKKIGVLCDFDLGSRVDVAWDGPTSRQRTGTKPFMAIELLCTPPPVHVFRHDLESLFYAVLLFICGDRWGDGSGAFSEWYSLSMEELRKEKQVFLIGWDPAPVSREYSGLKESWIRPLRRRFLESMTAIGQVKERGERIQGSIETGVSFEEIEEILMSGPGTEGYLEANREDVVMYEEEGKKVPTMSV